MISVFTICADRSDSIALDTSLRNNLMDDPHMEIGIHKLVTNLASAA